MLPSHTLQTNRNTATRIRELSAPRGQAEASWRDPLEKTAVVAERPDGAALKPTMSIKTPHKAPGKPHRPSAAEQATNLLCDPGSSLHGPKR
jgi:hypothetical protein